MLRPKHSKAYILYSHPLKDKEIICTNRRHHHAENERPSPVTECCHQHWCNSIIVSEQIRDMPRILLRQSRRWPTLRGFVFMSDECVWKQRLLARVKTLWREKGGIILWWIKKKYETFHVLPAALLWWYFMVCCVWSIFASSDPLGKKLTIIGWNPPGLLFWWASSQFHDFYLLWNMNHSWQMIFLFDVIHNQFERIDFQRAEGYLFTSPFVVEVSHFMLLFSSMLNRPWQPFVMG